MRLTVAQREELERLAATGPRAAAAITRPRILLQADAGRDGWTDDRVAQALGTSAASVARVRKRFVPQGLPAAVHRTRPTGRQYRELGGAPEARLIARACSPPPEGRDRWALRLLADKLVELRAAEAIRDDTVQRALKETRSSRT